MSGGTFRYHESRIEGMADYVRRTYLKHKSKEWVEFVQTQKSEWFKPYSKESLAIFKKAYKVLRTAYIYAKCIDYLEAGDYGEDSFKENLKFMTDELDRELKKPIKVSPNQIKTWIENYDEDDYWY
ncbi:hypothetical protein [Fibrobacter sp.]|uniref:hypothetical protein n=1 Tax=Fibrobacter sp. TaxID=35828 RepID=UPI0025BA20F2|nr:hypothetical protein [Fibrobacter sp.]MBR3073672.1 hypothetical protein [Fibrobacter sp.]